MTTYLEQFLRWLYPAGNWGLEDRAQPEQLHYFAQMWVHIVLGLALQGAMVIGLKDIFEFELAKSEEAEFLRKVDYLREEMGNSRNRKRKIRLNDKHLVYGDLWRGASVDQYDAQGLLRAP